jgi:hypothetical protein
LFGLKVNPALPFHSPKGSNFCHRLGSFFFDFLESSLPQKFFDDILDFEDFIVDNFVFDIEGKQFHVSFENFDGFEEGFNFGPEDGIFVDSFESVGNADPESFFFLDHQFKMIESGLLDEDFFMSQKDVVFLDLLFSVFVDNFLRLSFEIFFCLEFAHIMVETVNVIVEFVEFFVKLFERPAVNVPQFTDDNRIQNSQIPQ